MATHISQRISHAFLGNNSPTSSASGEIGHTVYNFPASPPLKLAPQSLPKKAPQSQSSPPLELPYVPAAAATIMRAPRYRLLISIHVAIYRFSGHAEFSALSFLVQM
jgi:hypothetical protein